MIWCVEDDSGIRDIEMYALNSAGFDTKGFEDGLSVWEALKKEKPELIILDVMLPGMDGIEILTKMKESVEYCRIPIILATAKGQEYDRIHGLDLGADDYLVKPFSVMEMVSRVKAVLRRTQTQKVSKLYKIGSLVVNLDERTVLKDGCKVQLTYKEFELLCMFLAHPGMVYTREQLFLQVWKEDYMGDSRTLDSHIRTLRQKLEEYGKMIETVRNVGYRWEADYDK
ncbi:MAG: response regulator transcription factor [Erysipelotrichaceae bacterium]|nr:response regulator transcription factor [Erysipelotrichaceae bacterium]